ncbi:MAG: hypothetical protein IPM79_29755 [Polyangiaceae bacterium]|nr:hypothetical protein [Polyangiaceae bacterium]
MGCPYVGELIAQAQQEQGAEACRTYMRAARIAKRFESNEYEGLLAKAYEANPLDRQVAAAFEGILVGSDRSAQLEALQSDYVEALTQRGRAQASFRFGTRWATRHQNVEIGAKFLEGALAADPHRDAALSFLKELWGTKDGNWERVLSVAEKAAGAKDPPVFAVAQAGLVAWRNMGNLMRARGWFEKLAALAPEHPAVGAFEIQIGGKLGAGSPADEAAADEAIDVHTSEPPPEVVAEAAVRDEETALPSPTESEPAAPPAEAGDEPRCRR